MKQIEHTMSAVIQAESEEELKIKDIHLNRMSEC